MTYLFWAFALVWLGVFAYLYALVRRSRALERQVSELLERSGAVQARGASPGRAPGDTPPGEAPAGPAVTISKTTGAGE